MGLTSDERLGQLLLQRGVISTEQLERARIHPAARRGGLVQGLSALGVASEAELLGHLARLLGVDQVALDRATLDPALADAVSFSLCERHDVMPLRVEAKTLLLAMADPGDLHAIDDLQFRVGMSVRPLVASQLAIRQAIRQIFPVEMSRLEAEADDVVHEVVTRGVAPVEDEGMAAEAASREAYLAGLQAAADASGSLDHPSIELGTEDKAVIRLLHELLLKAAAEELQQVRLDLVPDRLRVTFRSADQWHDETPLPEALRVRIRWHVKTLCGLPVGAVTRPLLGQTRIHISQERIRTFRVFVVPTVWGEFVLISPVPLGLQDSFGSAPSRGARSDGWYRAVRIGHQALQAGRFVEAEDRFRQAVAEAESQGDDGRVPLGEALVHLARALDEGGRTAEARGIYQRAVDLQQAELGADSPLLVPCITGLASASVRLTLYADAVAYYRQALLKIELSFGQDDFEAAWLLERIHQVCAHLGYREEADDCARECQDVLRRILDLDRSDVRFG